MALIGRDPGIREFTISLVEWNIISIISCKGLRPLFVLNVECYYIQSFKLCCLLLFKIKKIEILQKYEVNKSTGIILVYILVNMPYMAKLMKIFFENRVTINFENF